MVIFGTRNGFPDPLPIASLNGTNGFSLTTGPGYYVGLQTIGVGDLNGDGYADIIIAHGNANWIEIWVIFGGPTRIDGVPWAASQTLTALANGTNGFNIYNADTTLGAIYNITTGDINGDKIDDLVFSGAKLTYVVLGHTGAWPATVDPTTISSSSVLPVPQGFTINRNYKTGGIAIGDMNGDGYSDIALMDSGSVPGRSDNYGYTAVIYGSPSPISNYDLVATPLTGTNGFYIYAHSGSLAGAWGWPQSPIAFGDVNGDGLPDLLIGDMSASYIAGASSNAGTVFLIFGTTSTWPQINDIDAITGAHARAVRIDGPKDIGGHFPGTIAVADINGDSYGDIVITAYGNPIPNPYGSVYALFGHGGSWSNRSFYTQQPLGGTDGVRFDCSYSTDLNYCGNRNGSFGLWKTSASATSTDVNGDGINDLFIPIESGTSATGVTGAGYVYTIYGRKGFAWPAVFPLSSIK